MKEWKAFFRVCVNGTLKIAEAVDLFCIKDVIISALIASCDSEMVLGVRCNLRPFYVQRHLIL